MNVLLAVLFLLQEKNPEETFKKIEDTLEKAKSLQLKFSCSFALSPEGPWSKASASGKLLLKEGNKVKEESRLLWNGAAQDTTLTSDGTERLLLRTREDQVFNSSPSPASATMGRDYARRLLRTGVIPGQVLQYVYISSLSPKDLPPPETIFIASEFKAAQAPSNAVTFNVKRDKAEQTGKVELHYDPKNYAPLKLIVTFTVHDATWVLTETYSDVTLNGDIPDEAFTLPKQNK